MTGLTLGSGAFDTVRALAAVGLTIRAPRAKVVSPPMASGCSRRESVRTLPCLRIRLAERVNGG